ncbi:hypothetical protein D3C79_709050 [compost metagenome]
MAGAACLGKAQAVAKRSAQALADAQTDTVTVLLAVRQLLLCQGRKLGRNLFVTSADHVQLLRRHRLGQDQRLVLAAFCCVDEAFQALHEVVAVFGRQCRYAGDSGDAG